MTGPSPAQVRLNEAQFVKLRDLIYQVSGMDFSPNKKYLLEARLQGRLQQRKLKSFDEYLYFLKFDPRKQEEFTFLFNEVSTNETSFYRNMPQIKAFERSLLPQVLEEKRQAGSKKLRIWSAACSSGEEPFTLAIVVREVLKAELQRWHVEIIGNDISTDMLARARIGKYSEHSLRATPLTIRQRYFQKTPEGEYKIIPEVHAMVRFIHMNFSDKAKMKSMMNMDIIFCRNVLIYFDNEAKKRFVQHFYDGLSPGGHLFIGHSESLHNISRAFKMIHFPQAIAYKKEEN